MIEEFANGDKCRSFVRWQGLNLQGCSGIEKTGLCKWQCQGETYWTSLNVKDKEERHEGNSSIEVWVRKRREKSEVRKEKSDLEERPSTGLKDFFSCTRGIRTFAQIFHGWVCVCTWSEGAIPNSKPEDFPGIGHWLVKLFGSFTSSWSIT